MRRIIIALAAVAIAYIVVKGVLRGVAVSIAARVAGAAWSAAAATAARAAAGYVVDAVTAPLRGIAQLVWYRDDVRRLSQVIGLTR